MNVSIPCCEKSGSYLVGGAITILKNDGVIVNGKDDIPYMKWNIKAMIETSKPDARFIMGPSSLTITIL